MEIKVKDFIDDIVDGKFINSEMQVAIEDLDSALKQVISDFQLSVSQNKLSKQTLFVQGFNEEIQLSLESGIINLPFANISKVDNFFENPDDNAPVNLYLITQADDLNASKFRIDEVCSIDDLINHPAKTASMVSEMVHKNIEDIQKNIEMKTENKN